MATKPITNSVNETRLYYNRLLGYLIHHLEKTIAEIEAADTYTEEQEQRKSNSETTYTPKEAQVYDSVFTEQPPQDTPESEKIESLYSNETEIAKVNAPSNKISEKNALAQTETLEADKVEASETRSSLQQPEATLTELKQQLLSKKNKSQLEQFKSEIGAEKTGEIWESCTIPERNLIKCINATTKKGALPFDLVSWVNPQGRREIGRYVGFYRAGKQCKENERVIYLPKDDTFKVVDKRSLKGVNAKYQKPCPPDLATKLEAALEAQPEPE
ncbi:MULTISPECIES: hypothetical protein [Okeania]|nr:MULTISPECIES: hypothetical protein [Okeania]NET76653.1 hypothetical protein [Okeania sp. SIO1F9]NES77053.1 hypothetical protein [Okeania sp. SIO1H4]NES90381.1 hypothetical protein [Okeania sp. SIO2B9]NET18548.1 hypothetical protein [Okeania sp. SIO1H5]NET94891.1 hypothetical protein [Okeania sp. SIO1H2]